MTATSLPAILKTRLLVAYLGERSQYGWWPTSFYEASGRLFLEPVFSKTSRLAQYHGVLEAARRLHDEHLSVGSYHLFRLPEEYEQDLHSMISSSETAEALTQYLRTKEDAMSALRLLSANRRTSATGPQAVGLISELESAATVEAVAAAYVHSFQNNLRASPYLGSCP